MSNFTPGQQKAIQTWTEERDNLLREIGQYSEELNQLTKSTQEKGLAFADLEKSIAEARGRLSEINALEERMRNSLPADIAELEVRKSRLQGECSALDERLEGGNAEYKIITEAIVNFKSVHDTMKDQAAIVNRVVGEIIQTSTTHTSEMKTIMDEIRTISIEVIKKGNENVAQTGIILEKLPRYIFELQKPIPVRRMFSAPRGMQIPPEEQK